MPNLLPEITRVESIKILGAQIDSHLSVHEHVEMVCQTAAQALWDQHSKIAWFRSTFYLLCLPCCCTL